MTPAEAAGVVDRISATWGVDFTAERAAVWMDLLMDLPFDAAVRAVRSLGATRSTCPAPANLRREVMGAAGLLAPDPQTAVAQADRWLTYQDQRGYSNGSGWEPPEPNVHPAVVRACALVNGSFEGWRRDFLAAYDKVAARTEDGILSADYGHAVAALGDGS